MSIPDLNRPRPTSYQMMIEYTVERLHRAGYLVEADCLIPGLFWVNGRELTSNQMIDFANKGPGQMFCLMAGATPIRSET